MTDKYQDLSDRSLSDSESEKEDNQMNFDKLSQSSNSIESIDLTSETNQLNESSQSSELLTANFDIESSDKEEDNNTSETGSQRRKRPGKYFEVSINKKIKILDFLKTNLKKDGMPNISATARKYNMKRTTLIGWIGKEKELREALEDRNINTRESKRVRKRRNGYFPDIRSESL